VTLTSLLHPFSLRLRKCNPEAKSMI